jgi:hypothetical protein
MASTQDKESFKGWLSIRQHALAVDGTLSNPINQVVISDVDASDQVINIFRPWDWPSESIRPRYSVNV